MTKSNVSSAIVMDGDKFEGLLTLKNILRVVGSLKIPENFNIRFVGLNDVGLLAHQKEAVQKIASNEAFKLQRQIHDDNFSMVVHLKDHTKSDRERKYSISLHVDAPGQTFTVNEFDWRVEDALHMVFENDGNVLKRRLRGEKSRRKVF